MRRPRRRPFTAPTLLGVGALSTACATDGPREGVTVRDSAGITIVENAVELEALPEVTTAAEPSLRIGAVDGDPAYQFTAVRVATRLADGRIVVLDQDQNDVRVFGEDGRVLASFGGEGEGPDRFNRPQAVWALAPDTLLIHDMSNRRLATWTTSGKLVDVNALEPADQVVQANGMAAGQVIALKMESVAIMPGERAWFPYHIVGYGRDGRLTDTITSVPGSEWATIMIQGNAGTTGVRFTARTEIGTSGDRIVIARGEEPRVDLWSLEGALTRSIRWAETEDRDVRAEDLDAAIDEWRESLPENVDPAMVAAAEEMTRSIPAAERFPTTSGLKIATNGEIWVQRYGRPGEPRDAVYLVFTPEGELSRRVRLPADLLVLEVGEDYLLGTETDDLDVPYVVLYRFEPRP